MELSFRSIEFERSRVRGGKGHILCPEYHGKMQRVARAPYSAFAIDESLQPSGDGLASGVEAAERLFVAIVDLEIGNRIARGAGNHERSAGNWDFHHAVSPGTGLGNLLKLKVVHRQLHSSRGFGREQVACTHPDFVAA